jgi:hypothetical protein
MSSYVQTIIGPQRPADSKRPACIGADWCSWAMSMANTSAAITENVDRVPEATKPAQ